MKQYEYVILGDNRSGTTSIWTSFDWHPQICSGTKKEKLHRLPDDTSDLSSYVDENFVTTSKTKILLEGSPNLISFKSYLIDLLKKVPKIKRLRSIYTVRTPIERLYSYSHICLSNHCSREAQMPYFLTKDMKVKENSMRYMFSRECLYYRKIRLMEKEVGRDNLFIVNLNNLFEDFYKICDFLNIDRYPVPTKKLSRSLDHSLDVEHLRGKIEVRNWAEKHRKFIEEKAELDKRKINKRYGEIL
jgi:hypothetical protein